MRISAYRRPSSVEEALALLAAPGTVPLAGGTRVNALPGGEPVAVVDLQDLRLEGIERLDDRTIGVGAMTRLQELADAPEVPSALRLAARRERPSTLRAQATLGGCVVTADPQSELLAVLLVHDAVVSIAGPQGFEARGLAALLDDLPLPAGRIVTAVAIDTTGTSAVARVARTRADRPIVAAAARATRDGERRLALAGVAATPILLDGTADTNLDPPGDFRGSTEYRRAMAAVVAARAVRAVSR